MPAALAALVVLAGIAWWRWGLTVAVVIALLGGFLVWAVGVMPGRLAPPLSEPDLDGVTDAKARLDAIDARTRLRHDLRNSPLQWLTVLAVLVGAWLGFQQLAEDRDQARQDRQLTRQGQASERFTRAIDQLGSARVETRIGGIHGLDQIAEQAPENTGPVGEVLLAWLNGRPRPRPPPRLFLHEYAPDVQAALSVLTGQRYSSIVTSRLDLHGLDLAEADLRGAHLRGANLSEADLRHAHLRDADLGEANLTEADLRVAILAGADLRRAALLDADLTGADLTEADLRGALLPRTILPDANLRGADLRGAHLPGADLRGADLRGADLGEADLLEADLRGAKVDESSTKWPTGFDWRQAGVEIVP